MSRKNIVNYLKSNYRTGSIVIVATGAINHDKFLKKVRKYFSFESGKAIEAMSPTRNETKKKIIEQLFSKQNYHAHFLLFEDFVSVLQQHVQKF